MPSSYGNFGVFNLVYKLELTLENETPLSVSSGKDPSGGTDNPIVRLKGSPYIPGSTLKGLMRSEAERILKTIGVSVCDIMSNEELRKLKEGSEDYRPCLVCRIFGGPTIASSVTIGNALPKRWSTDTRTCVSINRITGGQHPGRLYDVEYVNPKSEFSWRVETLNLDILDLNDERSVVFNLLINKMQEIGIWIGGRKSVGHGLVRISKIDEVKRYDASMKFKDITEEYHSRLRELSTSVDEFIKLIREKER